MPSVHNGLAALFAIAAFRLWRPLGWVVAAYAALIWVGSIHLGWHYAIDGMVSIAMTFAIRSDEHTSELQSLMRTSYAAFCLKKKKEQLNTYVPRLTRTRRSKHLITRYKSANRM